MDSFLGSKGRCDHAFQTLIPQLFSHSAETMQCGPGGFICASHTADRKAGNGASLGFCWFLFALDWFGFGVRCCCLFVLVVGAGWY